MDNNTIRTLKSNNSFQIVRRAEKKMTDTNLLDRINNKMEFVFFKDDILKDVKNFEKNISEKYNQFDITINEQINNINDNINSINSKLNELSTSIISDNMMKEKVNNLDNIKKQLLGKMYANEVKINNIERETKESFVNLNNILNNTVIYKGVVGPSCKFGTFHELIDFILHELHISENFRVKHAMDLSSHKKKIDDNVYGMKLQMDNLSKSSTKYALDSFNIYDKKIKEINTSIEKIEKNLEDTFQNINIRLNDMENKIDKDINELKKDNENKENNINNHYIEYENFKEEINKKIKEIENKKYINLKRMNSQIELVNYQSEEYDENDKNFNSINNSTIKKRASLQVQNEDNSNDFINDRQNKKRNNENQEMNNNNNFYLSESVNPKISSKMNSKNNINFSNLSDTSIRNEKYLEKNADNQPQKSDKNIWAFPENNIKKINNTILNERRYNELKDNKSISKFLSKTHKNRKIMSYNNTNNNNMYNYEDINKSNNILTDREIKRQTISIKNNINTVYKNQKKRIDNNHNNNFFSDLNRLNYFRLGNNTINNRALSLKKSASTFKNIIITLEGTKKMIIDCKNSENKNIYHVESLNSNSKKFHKLNKKERISTSRPNKKQFFNSPKRIYSSDSDALIKHINNKNKKNVIFKNIESNNQFLSDNQINNILPITNNIKMNNL